MRIFLISPVRLDGVRGRVLREGRSGSPMAQALRSAEGAAIGEVFTYVSGLYFRGKLTYAKRFAQPPPTTPESEWLAGGVLVITQNRGLVPAESRIVQDHLEAFAETPIAADERGFVLPLTRDAALLREALGSGGQAVLLGSLATPKYVDPLTAILGERLVVPGVLRGKGDMARGALLLRQARSGEELAYEPAKLQKAAK